MRSTRWAVVLLLSACLSALFGAPTSAQRTPRLVRDLAPGPGGSSPSELVVAGDRVFFRGCGPATGCEP